MYLLKLQLGILIKFIAVNHGQSAIFDIILKMVDRSGMLASYFPREG